FGTMPPKLSSTPSQYPCWFTVNHPQPKSFPMKLFHGARWLSLTAPSDMESLRAEVVSSMESSSASAATARAFDSNSKTSLSSEPSAKMLQTARRGWALIVWNTESIGESVSAALVLTVVICVHLSISAPADSPASQSEWQFLPSRLRQLLL